MIVTIYFPYNARKMFTATRWAVQNTGLLSRINVNERLFLLQLRIAFLLSLNNESFDFMKILKDIANDTISISKSCKKQINDMDKIFKENCFKDASKK